MMYSDIIHQDDLYRIKKEIQEAIDNKLEHFSIKEYRIIDINEKVIWLKNFTTVIKDKDENVTHLLGYIEDITKQKQSELVIEKSQKIMNQTLNAFLDPIYITNSEFKIIYTNKAMEDLIGKDKIGSICYKSLYNFDQKCKWCSYAKLKKSRTLIEYDIHLSKSNKFFYVRNIIFDNNNKLTIFQDITKRKKAEKELKELVTTIDKFFSIIAHDLKSPFTTLLGLSDLLIDNIENYSKENIKNFIQLINESSKNTYTLLENLLTWSQTQTGHINCSPIKQSIKALVQNTVNTFQEAANQKNIQIIDHFDNDFQISFDKNMISTVIRNLISNAIKFTRKGGLINVYINLLKDKNQIKVSINDSGIGIDKEKIRTTLNFENNTSTIGTNGEKGTGLGLTICNEFIKKHNGDLIITSKRNKGSTFSFTLPLG